MDVFDAHPQGLFLCVDKYSTTSESSDLRIAAIIFQKIEDVSLCISATAYKHSLPLI